jgi:hypothetical protein
MTNSSVVEGVASAIQFVASQVAKASPGGIAAEAAATYLTGQLALTTSMSDLAVKLQNGTATPEDVAEVSSKAATTLAGLGVMTGGANQAFLRVAGTAGLFLFLYKEFVPKETKQEIWDVLFKKIIENPFSNGIDISYCDINPTANTCYGQARTPPRKDPLALDLDGDGIETIGVTASTQVL